MTEADSIRAAMRLAHLADQNSVLGSLIDEAGISPAARMRISAAAANLVDDIRDDDNPGLMEVFLAEYGLSTDEGVALMCLAEALLRVPDADTIDELIEDKIAPSHWGEHLGKSSSSLVNASTWALMLTGKVLDDREPEGLTGVLRGVVKRLGEPVIRTAVKRAMKEMGNQFVLGETIEEAVRRGMDNEQKGYAYSYDMLGEAALTAADAAVFFESYKASIDLLASRSGSGDIRDNPGISIKLSALHPRYEVGQKNRVMDELVASTMALTLQAKEANIGLNIDAEEADRLDLSLDVIESVLSDPRLIGWDGFGVVVQAYGKRAAHVIDWLHRLATRLDRRIMVRLVKGAYWDSEIKRAQVEGLPGFPVFTNKAATDVSYLCCAKKLFDLGDRIYPQFATHNAHSVSAVLEMADGKTPFEFQRLHGMGEALHGQILEKHNARCRIYAPVGAHKDLLAYLVRRLLENGANSSFVNQIVDEAVPSNVIAADPFSKLESDLQNDTPEISLPTDLYQPERENSRGWDLHNETDLAEIEEARSRFRSTVWAAGPLTANPEIGGEPVPVFNPAKPDDLVGHVVESAEANVDAALAAAKNWGGCVGEERARILTNAAALYESNFGELFAVLTREAGKTPMDAIAELREAVDFLRYYASQIKPSADLPPRGIVTCISPWNFPLAIFTGQIAAALAAGNGVLAKPAEPTSLTAHIAVKLLHKSGVPTDVLQLLPGKGSVVGAKLTSDERICGVCFTGSTATAQVINTSMARHLDPTSLFIAETGGLNAMIVDSTALPQQAVSDIVVSAFQSAGQRCSALRLLYLQEDIAEDFLQMLYGAMDELNPDDPWLMQSDLGPVINAQARNKIARHVDAAGADGRLMKQTEVPQDGYFVAPTVIKVDGIQDLREEIFGPILHVATFRSQDVDTIISDINATGYGLTFGLHTRIDDRVEQITSTLRVGNMYVNRNQIGAIVGSQPFGGEGLSGTGPKAGGPSYLPAFQKRPVGDLLIEDDGARVSAGTVEDALSALKEPSRRPLTTFDLPGPTGESNRLSPHPRGRILCLGPTPQAALDQAAIARKQGCSALIVCPGAKGAEAVDGFLERSDLTELQGYEAVALWSGAEDLRRARIALSKRAGPLIPLLCERDMSRRCVIERHICIDTTAAGGNATLLAGAA